MNQLCETAYACIHASGNHHAVVCVNTILYAKCSVIIGMITPYLLWVYSMQV